MERRSGHYFPKFQVPPGSGFNPKDFTWSKHRYSATCIHMDSVNRIGVLRGVAGGGGVNVANRLLSSHEGARLIIAVEEVTGSALAGLGETRALHVMQTQ